MGTIFAFLQTHAGLGFAIGLASAFTVMAGLGMFNRVRG
jgi:hypothetical protein